MTGYLRRGNKLWEGSRMFLPQHKQALLHRKKEQQKVTKPELDEQELTELNQALHMALAKKVPVRLTYYQDGGLYECVGRVRHYVENSKELRMIDRSQQTHVLKIRNIIEVVLSSSCERDRGDCQF